MKLHLLDFIQNNPNWEKLLSEKPYSLSIKRDGEYILFMYSQIDSDFSNPIVQECRGITFYEETWQCVSMRFKKFFNVQEENASNIDWSTARVQEKVDGSLIAVWYHNHKWHVSTNGTIDAKNAELQMPIKTESYYKPLENYFDLFVYADKTNNINWIEQLDKSYCYIFELVSPYNKVVVPYQKTEIYHIGTRNMITLEEENVDIGIKKPKLFNLRNVDECIQVAENLPFNEEGFVVVDSFWNRVKIKSVAYVAAHHLKNNGVVTYSRILDLIKLNEDSEFLSYYPEYKETFEMVRNELESFIEECEHQWKNRPEPFQSRKDLALWAGKYYCPPVLFSLYDGKHKTVKEWLYNQQNDKILKWIGVE